MAFDATARIAARIANGPKWATWTKWALWASLFLFAASLSLHEIRAYDYWWHLRTGALIAQTGAVPLVDSYTFTVPGARWIDIPWLHQLGLHGLYSLGGHSAVGLARMLMVLGVVALLAPIGVRRERPAMSALALGLMLLTAFPRFTPRPEISSFVLLAATLWMLDGFSRRGDRRVYAIVGIQLLWVNLHGLFVLGVGLCGIQLVSELLESLLRRGTGLRTPRLRRLAALTALCALACLANPNGLDGARVPFAWLGAIGPGEDRGEFGALITELTPLFGGQRSPDPIRTGFFAALALLSALAMALNLRRLRVSDAIVWIVFLVAGLGAQRNLALFAIVATPILVRNANELLDAVPTSYHKLRTAVAAALALLFFLLVIAVVRGDFYPMVGSRREPGLGADDARLPIGAADWIARERPAGPICHRMAIGGYLIWRLHPDYPVMSDGRSDVFGPKKLVGLQMTGPENFRALDARYQCGIVLVTHSRVEASDLLWWLKLEREWRLALVDDVAALFVRRGEDTSHFSDDIELGGPDLFPPLSDEHSLRDMDRRAARARFYSAMHRYRPALGIWQEALSRYPELPNGASTLAALLYRNGFPKRAQATLHTLLDEKPGDAALHAQVAGVRLAAGERRAALDLYDTALALDSNLIAALYPRATLALQDGDLMRATRLYRRLLERADTNDPRGRVAEEQLRALGAEP